MSWKVSSEVTKVPLAKSRRLFVMESKLSERMDRKEGQEEDGEVQGEVTREIEESQGQPLMCMA